MKKRNLVRFIGTFVVLGVSGALFYGTNLSVQANEQEVNVIVEKDVPTDTTAPVISGQKNWTVTQGDELNVLKDVVATDDQSIDVSLVATKVSTDKVGTQEVVISAEDESHNHSSQTIKVKVEKKKEVVSNVTTNKEEIPEIETANIIETSKEEEPQEVAYQEEVVETTETPTSESNQSGANMLNVAGQWISYQNAGEGSGQSVIDNNRNIVATWGGASVQSGTDGLNTHFIGHNPGVFNALFQVGIGNQITVTDAVGAPTNYTVNNIVQVDDYGVGVADGVAYIDQIAGTEGGERITLQTCVNESINLIIFASAQ